MCEENLNKIEKYLCKTNTYLVWYDGSEWIVSLNGEENNSKTICEIIKEIIN